ncbi:MAG TPA: hypothetical protein VFE33_20550 [Thermoanaerobaculia bacterium]|nr:hypothetical protein [Thermoanaerobaculia bacterium]
MRKMRKINKLELSRETLRALDPTQLQPVVAALTTPVTLCNHLCTERCTQPTCHC